MMNSGNNISSEDLYDYGEPQGRLRMLLHRTNWRWIIGGIISLSFAIPFLIVHLSSATTTAIDDGGGDNNLLLKATSDKGNPSNAALFMESPPPTQNFLKSSSFESNSLKKSAGKRPGGGRLNPKKTRKPTLPPPPPPSSSTDFSSSSSSSSTEFKASGVSSSLPTEFKNFTDFHVISAGCSNNNSLATISLSNFCLDAESFSQSLVECTGLESISLENIWLLGNFSRITLPSLKTFVYSQNENDKRDSYKSPETLYQTLFFDKVPPTTTQQSGSGGGLPSSWSVEQDLLNLGVDIRISKGGTKLIDINRNGDGESGGVIFLNVKYCEDTLVNVKGSFDSLTLINCNVTTASLPVIPSTLKYLNLRNSVQRTPQLADLLRKQTELEELYLWLTFHCDWPGYELFININDLPLTVKKLGMNNADSTYNSQNAPASSIKELTIGDYTTNTTVLEGFPKLFPNLERINIVNISDPSPAAGYSMLRQVIEMKVKEIAVVHLHRNYSSTIEGQEEIIQVESVLDHAGIPKAIVSSFLLKLNENATTTTEQAGVVVVASSSQYIGRELSVQESHQIRYEGLGFDQIDSFEDYIKWDSLK